MQDTRHHRKGRRKVATRTQKKSSPDTRRTPKTNHPNLNQMETRGRQAGLTRPPAILNAPNKMHPTACLPHSPPPALPVSSMPFSVFLSFPPCFPASLPPSPSRRCRVRISNFQGQPINKPWNKGHFGGTKCDVPNSASALAWVCPLQSHPRKVWRVFPAFVLLRSETGNGDWP